MSQNGLGHPKQTNSQSANDQAGHAIVERAAHQLARELVGEPVRGHLLDHAVRDRLLEGRVQLRVCQPGPRDRGEVEFGSGYESPPTARSTWL
jgi:hypothetical protein